MICARTFARRTCGAGRGGPAIGDGGPIRLRLNRCSACLRAFWRLKFFGTGGPATFFGSGARCAVLWIAGPTGRGAGRGFVGRCVDRL